MNDSKTNLDIDKFKILVFNWKVMLWYYPYNNLLFILKKKIQTTIEINIKLPLLFFLKIEGMKMS